MSAAFDWFTGRAIRLYRASPLYPSWGARLARLLALVQRGSGGPIVRELGPFRMELSRDRVVDAQIYYTGTFEPAAVDTIRRLVRPGDTAIDVGANIGFMTLTLAERVGPGGRVIAFEPTAAAFARLERNLALNAFPQARAERVALGEAEQTVTARIESSYRMDGTPDAGEEPIRVVSLDAWAKASGVDRLDFLKIDTDGFEGAVLRGARECLRRFRPSILFELGPDALAASGDSPAAVLDLLTSGGYQLLREGALTPVDPKACVASIASGTSVNLVALHPDRGLPPVSA